MIKLGAYLIYGEETPQDRLRIIKAAGFDQICTSIETMELGPENGVTPEFCAGIGLEIQHLHLTGSKTNLLWADDEAGDAIVDRFCRQIAECRRFGVKTGVLHALWGGVPQPAPMGEVGLSRFQRIVECAEKNDVILALENSVLDEYFRYLLDNIKSDKLRFCFDSGHHHAFGLDEDILVEYNDKLAATHLHDNDGVWDIHMMPMDGTIDWEKMAKSMAKCPYAHESIVSETCGETSCKMPGKTVEELEAIFASTAAYRDGLMDITDGKIVVYDKLSYEEKFDRLYKNMRRLADMIEAEA